jgi:hypothetical protein
MARMVDYPTCPDFTFSARVERQVDLCELAANAAGGCHSMGLNVGGGDEAAFS